MRLCRGEDRDARPLLGEPHSRRHAEACRDRREIARQPLGGNARGVELDALEEHTRLDVDVLLGVDDVALEAEQELGNAVHHPALIRAGQKKYACGHLADSNVEWSRQYLRWVVSAGRRPASER